MWCCVSLFLCGYRLFWVSLITYDFSNVRWSPTEKMAGWRHRMVKLKDIIRLGTGMGRSQEGKPSTMLTSQWAVNYACTSEHIIWLLSALQTKMYITIKFVPKIQRFWDAKWISTLQVEEVHCSKMFVPACQTTVQCCNSEDHSNNELLHFFSPLLDFDETGYKTFLLHRNFHV